MIEQGVNASFLRINMTRSVTSRHLNVGTFRPCPLSQKVYGATETKNMLEDGQGVVAQWQ